MNEQNENMELEAVDTTTEYEEPETAESGGSGFGIGLAVGAGLAVLVGAGVKKAKKLYAKYKDRKLQKEAEVAADEEVPEAGDNVVPIAQEDDTEEE